MAQTLQAGSLSSQWSREFEGIPAAHSEQVDKTISTPVTVDTGVVGLKYIRCAILVKSGMSNGNTIRFVLRTGTGAAVTSPEVVWTSPIYTFVTGDTNLIVVGEGFSNAGFQSYTLSAVQSGGAAVVDAIFDCV